MGRLEDGSRKIICISEVLGMEAEVITMQDLFVFKRRSRHASGRIEGEFISTGFLPKFFQELESRGLEIDPALFSGGGTGHVF